MQKFVHKNRSVDLKGVYVKRIIYQEEINITKRPYMEDDFFIA